MVEREPSISEEQLHAYIDGQIAGGECPTAYRPATIDAAQAELTLAERTEDPALIFIARGNLQRLRGRDGNEQAPARRAGDQERSDV